MRKQPIGIIGFKIRIEIFFAIFRIDKLVQAGSIICKRTCVRNGHGVRTCNERSCGQREKPTLITSANSCTINSHALDFSAVEIESDWRYVVGRQIKTDIHDAGKAIAVCLQIEQQVIARVADLRFAKFRVFSCQHTNFGTQNCGYGRINGCSCFRLGVTTCGQLQQRCCGYGLQ